MKNNVHDPVHHYIQDTLQRLIQLNELEDQLETRAKWHEKGESQRALIESLRAHLLPSVLAHHDRIRAKGKHSIAAVHHGVCSGCHMELAIGNLHVLQRGDELRHCGNCGRYVYLAAEGDNAKKPAAAAKKSPPVPSRSEPALATA